MYRILELPYTDSFELGKVVFYHKILLAVWVAGMCIWLLDANKVDSITGYESKDFMYFKVISVKLFSYSSHVSQSIYLYKPANLS